VETIALASASARRAELLNQIHIPFRILPQDTDEQFDPKTNAKDNAIRLATDKLEACKTRHPEQKWILAADTFIELEGKFIGKPANRNEARSMLQSFSGKTQKVITGVALWSAAEPNLLASAAETDVHFSILKESEIDWYLDTADWQGVAGAYKIQGLAAVLVDYISGSYSNVMGLPIHLIYGMLRKLNYQFTAV
jgi:septum formation protein